MEGTGAGAGAYEKFKYCKMVLIFHSILARSLQGFIQCMCLYN